MKPAIERARPDDGPGIERLLAHHQLPLAGLREHLSSAVVARGDGTVVGGAALELYGDAALLRSVAVAPEWQGQGLGRQLTDAACRLAREHDVTELYLLTTTASEYFLRAGFEPIAREDVADAVTASIEFTSACPASATVMRLRFAPTVVLFACVHNAGRSQMAAAFFNRTAAPAKARALSAGTQPAGAVHPPVAAAMAEAGVDLSAARPERLTADLAGRAQWLITMGCGEECPVVPGIRREDWQVPDPKGQLPEVVRAIRDEVRERVRALIVREGWLPAPDAAPERPAS